jgi:hypothetical protein
MGALFEKAERHRLFVSNRDHAPGVPAERGVSAEETLARAPG